MRRLSTILALVLSVALFASFAASAEDISTIGIGSDSRDIMCEFESVSVDKTTVIYSVDVKWDDVEFAYDAGELQWNPEKHDYTAVKDGGSWSNGGGKITVTNHSNAGVSVAVSAAPVLGQDVSFNIADADKSFTLATAVDTPVTGAPSKEVTFTANGAPTASDAKIQIGTITVAITAAE